MKHQKLNAKRFFICTIILSAFAVSALAQKQGRFVENNILVSDKLPKIEIAIDKDFKYVGRFDFKIRDVAAGERFIFVDAKNKKVKRMFIAQFEGFLPGIDNFYRYSFDNALTLGSHKFRHNNYAYSNKESREKNPKGEATLTFDFLKDKGYELEDELMMSRFLTVPDAEKKHELILYYVENVSKTNQKLAEFYENDEPTKIWETIGNRLKERSLKAFKIEG